MNIICTLALFLAKSAVAVAEPAKAVDPDTIKDKVSITLGQEIYLKFKQDGDRLREPKSYKGTDDDNAMVKLELKLTDSTPVPVRGVATRPYLVVFNGYEKTLHYRVLARLKGSKEFFEMSENLEPAPPGEGSHKCWESGSLVEEVVLYQFTFSKKPSK